MLPNIIISFKKLMSMIFYNRFKESRKAFERRVLAVMSKKLP